MPDPLLVATDGGRTAASALRFAAAYADSEQIPVEVVSVVEPLSDLPMPLPHREELEQAHARGVADRVQEHLRDVVGPVDWPIHVCRGRPAPAICQEARARSARLVVLGVDRKPDGNSTAVELLHLAEKPVLIAREAVIPHSALVGIDFRGSSLRAAHEAVRLIGPGGTVHLVHVKPSLDFPAASVWDWGDCYECAVQTGFEKLAEDLRKRGAGDVQLHSRSGDPVTEVLELADELEVGLLAIGSDGYICNGRVVVGRVARRLIAEATVAVLATPVALNLDGPALDPAASDRLPVVQPA